MKMVWLLYRNAWVLSVFMLCGVLGTGKAQGLSDDIETQKKEFRTLVPKLDKVVRENEDFIKKNVAGHENAIKRVRLGYKIKLSSLESHIHQSIKDARLVPQAKSMNTILGQANLPKPRAWMNDLEVRILGQSPPDNMPDAFLLSVVDSKNKPKPGQKRKLSPAEIEVAAYKKYLVDHQSSAYQADYVLVYLEAAGELAKGQLEYASRVSVNGELGYIAALQGASEQPRYIKVAANGVSALGGGRLVKGAVQKTLQKRKGELIDGFERASQSYADQVTQEIHTGALLVLEQLGEQGIEKGRVSVNFSIEQAMVNLKSTGGEGSVFVFRDSEEPDTFHIIPIGKGYPFNFSNELAKKVHELSSRGELNQENIESAWKETLMEVGLAESSQEAEEMVLALQLLQSKENARLDKIASLVKKYQGNMKNELLLYQRATSEKYKITRPENIQNVFQGCL